jgi:hypothetical protein
MNNKPYNLEGWIDGDPPFFFVIVNNGLTLKLLSLLAYG